LFICIQDILRQDLRLEDYITAYHVACSGSPTAAKEVGQPQISSAGGRQVSAPPSDTDDVTGRQLDNDAEESSDADGWDDAWDDEEKWGDMEVRSVLSFC